MSERYAVVSGGVLGTDYDVSTNDVTQTITFKTVKTYNIRFVVYTDLSYIIVGGGGAGAGSASGIGGGGGGGGDALTGVTWVNHEQSYTITVGAGGTASKTNGGNGGKSSFSSFNVSGGLGGVVGLSGGLGGNSGSGALGGAINISTVGNPGQLYGGGGSGGTGNNGPGGSGANGKLILSTYYGGGGGGGGNILNVSGGLGGGGLGGYRGASTFELALGQPGSANTGGGGGGDFPLNNFFGGEGGSGIVILTYTIRPPPCFKEDTKILTVSGYKTVQDLRKGDLIKTRLHGFVPIYAIGKKNIYHPASDERIKEQLYKYTTDAYPEVFEDLVITGCHSILVDAFKEREEEKTFEFLKGIYVTDEKYRLPACIDKRSVVYETPGEYTIYHFALEHNDEYMNCGVYANGLLVETCSKRYITEFSNMTLIE